MKTVTSRTQLIIAFAIMVIGHFTAHLLQNGACINSAYVIIGLLFLVNPVYPDINHMVEPQKGRIGARIAGIIIVILGLVIKNVM
ncbi:MAG: hypothetical protein LUG47_09970 [Clostridiales bacterium]|nr:hypothetical protein [Clostridiales bacterium]